MRRLVSVRVVDELCPIDGADAIELAVVGGWGVVVKKNEFKVGDRGVFFEIDSFISKSDERFTFLHKNAIKWNGIEGIRIKSIRLRGQLSQGLILPLSVFPEIAKEVSMLNNDQIDELDFTELVGVVKWEPPVVANMGGAAKGNFPGFIQKTDQDRYQGLAKQFKKIVQHNQSDKNDDVITFEVTTKIDGSSLSVYVCPDYNASGVCSRNVDLAESDENVFWQTAKNFHLLETAQYLIDLHDNNGVPIPGIVFQGEMFGAGINGNHEGINAIEYRLFDVWIPPSTDGKTLGYYLTPAQRRNIVQLANDMRVSNGWDPLKQAPLQYDEYRIDKLNDSDITIFDSLKLQFPDSDDDDIMNKTISVIMEQLQLLSEGESLYVPTREGVVFKANQVFKQLTGNISPFTFKAISNSYLLAHNDRG